MGIDTLRSGELSDGKSINLTHNDTYRNADRIACSDPTAHHPPTTVAFANVKPSAKSYYITVSYPSGDTRPIIDPTAYPIP